MNNDNFAYFYVPESLKNICLLEDCLFNCEDPHLSKKELYFYNNNILLFINEFFFEKFSNESLSKLWKKGTEYVYDDTPLTHYLYHQNIINEDEICLNSYEDFSSSNQKLKEIYNFPQNEIDNNKNIFINDDLDSFCSQIAYKEINDYVDYLLYFSLIYSSRKIFKYLYLNYKEHISDSTIDDAIKGGDEEIIQLLSNEYDFNEKLTISIKYHHHNITKWLIENYKCEYIPPTLCIEFFNTTMFSYIIHNNPEMIERKDHLQKNSLIIASQLGNVEIVKFLILKGCDLTQKDIYGFGAEDYSQGADKIEILNMITKARKQTNK